MTSYDTVAYPSATFPQTHPDRLALIARLHGLAAPAIDTARVLEIGGGDGFNLIALAAAWPAARFFSFDLSGESIRRGQALVAAAGMMNIRVELADILDFAQIVEPESFDYIIAHGVYAWVPPVVQQAILALIGQALAPDGVAFISFNALPGGHIRRVMRELLLHECAGIVAIADRMRAARAFLEQLSQPRDNDDAVVSAIRAQAVAMLGRPDAVLFHDELGECFEPVSLSRIAADAGAHGLEFLDDAGRNRLGDGFLPPDAPPTAPATTAAILRAAQSDDFAAMRFFRQGLFVRAGRDPARRPQLDSLGACWATGQFVVDSEGGIRAQDTSLALRDGGLSDWLLRLGQTWPAYQLIADLGKDPDRMGALYRLLQLGLIHISTLPQPFRLEVGARPLASPLARAQLALGSPRITTLHFEQMKLDDPAARGLIAALDGENDHQRLAQVWASLPHAPALGLDQALTIIATQRLLPA